MVGWNIAAGTRHARPHRSLTPVMVDALADLESLQPDLEAYYARYGPLYARGPCGASRPSLPGARTVARIHNPRPEQLCWMSSLQKGKWSSIQGFRALIMALRMVSSLRITGWYRVAVKVAM